MKPHKMNSITNRYAIISVCILLLFVYIFTRFADELIEQQLHRFDQRNMEWIQGMINPKLTSIMKFFTFFGSPTALFIFGIISVVLMICLKKRWEALFLVISIGGGACFNGLLKWIFHRQRPELHRLIEEAGYSFPSAHSMVSFIFYGMLAMFCYMLLRSKLLKWIIIVAAILLVLSIGVSRVYLGVHYPSDVVAGFAAGGAWLTICLMGLKMVLTIRGTKNLN